MSIRNELLRRISIAYGGIGVSNIQNDLLVEICDSLNITPRNENIRNMLLEDILTALGGSTDWANNGDWADNGDWA